MKRRAWILLATLLAFVAPAAVAEEWVKIASADDGAKWEVDIGTVVANGGVAQAWVKNTPRRPQRHVDGKMYRDVTWTRFDDCKNRRYDLGASIYYDAQGRAIASYQERPNREWQPIVPGTVGEQQHKALCGLAQAQAVDDIRVGQWKSAGLGKSPDPTPQSYSMYVLMDQITRLDDDHIVVMSRADYGGYQYNDGIPYRYAITANLIDCPHRRISPVGNYYYSTPLKLVAENETDPDPAKMIQIPPGTFAYQLHETVCSAPGVALKDAGEDEDEAGGMSAGTAWATTKGYLITASHVVSQAASIAVYQNGQKLGEARLVADDPANDVAILKFTPADGAKLRIIPLADRPSALGRPVFVLGYPAPDIMGQRIKMNSGEVSGTAGIQDDARYLQISVPVQPGNSGGPVIGFDGSAVGVVSAKLRQLGEGRDAPRPENVNYAIKIAYLRPLLEDLPDLKNYAPLTPNAPADALIAQAQEAVFMLLVTRREAR